MTLAVCTSLKTWKTRSVSSVWEGVLMYKCKRTSASYELSSQKDYTRAHELPMLDSLKEMPESMDGEESKEIRRTNQSRSFQPTSLLIVHRFVHFSRCIEYKVNYEPGSQDDLSVYYIHLLNFKDSLVFEVTRVYFT